MKKFFVNVKFRHDVTIPEEIRDKKVGLVSSIQYMDQMEEVKQQLPNAIIAGHAVGCNASRAMQVKDDVDCFFFIGEGRFHPLEIAMKTGKEVFVGSGDKVTQEEIDHFKQQQRGRQMKYLAANKLGILVSLKPGQYNLKAAQALKRKLKDKECFIFMDDTYDLDNLENFPGIEMFINTACSRIEKPNIINLNELPA